MQKVKENFSFADEKWSGYPKKEQKSYSRSSQNSKYKMKSPHFLYSKLNLCYSIGTNVKLLIDRPDGLYCFREKKDRVYYVSEKILNLANTLPPDQLIIAGTCFGKFTKTNKFRLHITALNYLAPYAQVKIAYKLIWILKLIFSSIKYG